MVSERQRRDIKEKMRAIKEAKKNNRPQRIIEKRTNELTEYLHQEGIINPFDE